MVGTEGRPHVYWLDQLCKDAGFVPANVRIQVVLRGHSGAMHWPKQAGYVMVGTEDVDLVVLMLID